MPTQAEQYARMKLGVVSPGEVPYARGDFKSMRGLLDEAMVPHEIQPGYGTLLPSDLQSSLWDYAATGELDYGPDDPRIQPALVPGQYELVDMQGNRQMVGEPRQRRSVTTGRPRQASTETLRRGDQWQQPSQVASTSAMILDQIRAAVEVGLISPARAKELLMRLQGSMPPQ